MFERSRRIVVHLCSVELFLSNSIDNDWSAQATTGTYGTLAAYQQSDKSNLIMSNTWYPSREEAFDCFITKLDHFLDMPKSDDPMADSSKERSIGKKRALRKKRKAERRRKANGGHG